MHIYGTEITLMLIGAILQHELYVRHHSMWRPHWEHVGAQAHSVCMHMIALEAL